MLPLLKDFVRLFNGFTAKFLPQVCYVMLAGGNGKLAGYK